MATFNRAYPEAAWWLKVVGWLFVGPLVITYAVGKWLAGRVMALLPRNR